MKTIPTFHTKAVKEAAERTKAARGERERASNFLSDLDELLSEGFNEVIES